MTLHSAIAVISLFIYFEARSVGAPYHLWASVTCLTQIVCAKMPLEPFSIDKAYSDIKIHAWQRLLSAHRRKPMSLAISSTKLEWSVFKLYIGNGRQASPC